MLPHADRDGLILGDSYPVVTFSVRVLQDMHDVQLIVTWLLSKPDGHACTGDLFSELALADTLAISVIFEDWSLLS